MMKLLRIHIAIIHAVMLSSVIFFGCEEDEGEEYITGTCEALTHMIWDCEVFPEKFYDYYTQDGFLEICQEEQGTEPCLDCYLECDVDESCSDYQICIFDCDCIQENVSG